MKTEAVPALKGGAVKKLMQIKTQWAAPHPVPVPRKRGREGKKNWS
jgi:hypothetical protein